MLVQMDLTDIYRTVHPTAAAYTCFSSAHESFSKIDCILSHKTNFNKFENIEVISSIFSDHNGIILEINYKEKN